MSSLWWLPFGQVPEFEAVDRKARSDQSEALQLVDVRMRGDMISWHRAKFPTTRK